MLFKYIEIYTAEENTVKLRNKVMADEVNKAMVHRTRKTWLKKNKPYRDIETYVENGDQT